MADILIKPKHLHSMPSWNTRPGVCNRGARKWAARHGIDWTQFVTHGVPAQELTGTGDAMALRLVAHATEMEARHG